MIVTARSLAISGVLVASLVEGAHGWSPCSTPSVAPRRGRATATTSSLDAERPSSPSSSRRDALGRLAGGVATGVSFGFGLIGGTSVEPAFAASTPSPAELTRLQRGHARVRYLIENWDSLTQICGTKIMSNTERKQVIRTEGGGGGDGAECEKNPLRVQEFLGYKSTEDPLFKADKLMVRAAPLVDPDDFEAYLDTVEKYREKADMGSMMAYTSSWGEANPNGGKEVIDDYLIKTKDEVILTEKLLRKVLGYLGLEVLPISK